jgi:hypothetical protein
MVLESSQQPVKRGRGRPRKTPVPETVSHHKESKKTTKNVSSDGLSWEEELAAFESRSNKSWILTLLVLLLWIALIWYWMYLKLHQADSLDDDMPTNPPVVDWSQQSEPAQPAEPDSTPPVWAWDSIVQDYFVLVNNGQFSWLAELEDETFVSNSALRNYFNPSRLATFANNVLGGVRIENFVENTTDPAIWRNPALNTKVYDFELVYVLKSDELEYRDTWRAYTVQRENRVINWFLYQWPSAANSPFFQFNKYWIK